MEDHIRSLGQKWGNEEEKKDRKSHVQGLGWSMLFRPDSIKIPVPTKVETIVSDDRGSGELIVELVFANDLIGFASLEDGEGAVPGSQKNPAVRGHR